MAKCMYCGENEVIGKAKTCSSKCRKALSRATVTKGTPSVTLTVTDSKCDTPTVTTEQQYYNDWQEEIINLPLGVVKPRWKPGIIPKIWQESRAYFDTIVRLLALTVAELKEQGQWIPSWKYKSEGLLR